MSDELEVQGSTPPNLDILREAYDRIIGFPPIFERRPQDSKTVGAQGASPPEPPKGMNGSTGNKGSPGIVGVPQWGCDLGSGEVWIRGDNTLAPEIPETEEMIAAGCARQGCSPDFEPGRRVATDIYRAMRAKEPTDLTTAQCWSAAVDHGKQMLAERNNVLEIATEQAHKINTAAIEQREARLALDAALARVEAAERHRREMFELKEHYRERMVAAETRLAERDASFNRLRWRP